MKLNDMIADVTEIIDINICAVDEKDQLHIINFNEVADFDLDYPVLTSTRGTYDVAFLISYEDFKDMIRRKEARNWS